MGDGPLGFDADDDGEPPARRPAPPRSPPPRGMSSRRGLATVTRGGWITLVVGLALLAYITVNTLRTSGPGSVGPPVGSLAPVFAAPTVAGNLEGAVNVALEAGQGKAKTAACDIHRADVINACDLWRRRPVVLVFFATREASGCLDELDRVQRVSQRERGVTFVAVTIKGNRGDIREMAARRGWRFPIAYDEYAILSNLYGVAVCPAFTYVRAGGRVAGTDLGTISERVLETQVRRLRSGQPVPRAT